MFIPFRPQDIFLSEFRFFFLSETLNNILREFIQEYMAINSMLQKIRS